MGGLGNRHRLKMPRKMAIAVIKNNVIGIHLWCSGGGSNKVRLKIKIWRKDTVVQNQHNYRFRHNIKTKGTTIQDEEKKNVTNNREKRMKTQLLLTSKSRVRRTLKKE